MPNYARTHPEVPPGDYAMLTIRDTGDGSNAESLNALEGEAVIRKGRSLGLTACYDVIDRLGGHLCVSRLAHETVSRFTCHAPERRRRIAKTKPVLGNDPAIFGWRFSHVSFEDAVELRD